MIISLITVNYSKPNLIIKEAQLNVMLFTLLPALMLKYN